MKRTLFDPIEPFSLAPLVALLPRRGRIERLSTLTSSLFARFEKVNGLIKESDSQANADIFSRLNKEREMLKQVLEWLEVNTQES